MDIGGASYSKKDIEDTPMDDDDDPQLDSPTPKRIKFAQHSSTIIPVDRATHEDRLAYGVGVLTRIYFGDLLSNLKEIADEYPECKDFYDSVFREVTKLVWLLFDEQDMLQLFCYSEFRDSKYRLRSKLGEWSQRSFPVSSVCHLIYQMDFNEPTYKRLWEEEIGNAIWWYAVLQPLSCDEVPSDGEPMKEIDMTDKFFIRACETREQLRHMTVQDRLHLHKELLFATCGNMVESLCIDAVKGIQVDSLYSLDNEQLWKFVWFMHKFDAADGASAAEAIDDIIKFLIDEFARTRQLELRAAAGNALAGFLSLVRGSEFGVSEDTMNVIKFANAVRRAEGHRFIGRHHFVQAYEELGFGYCFTRFTADGPVEILKPSTAERPPIKLYETCVQLVMYLHSIKQLRGKTINPEHLAFVVIHGFFRVHEVAGMGQRFMEKFKTCDSGCGGEQRTQCLWEPNKSALEAWRKIIIHDYM